MRFLVSLLLIFAFTAPAQAETVHMLLRTVWPMKAGEKVDCQLYLWTDKGPLSMEDMKTDQGAKLHLVLISADRKDFYHVYPQETGEGEFRFTLKPARKVPLRGWAIYITDEGRQVEMADMNGASTATSSASLPKDQMIEQSTDSMIFSIHIPRKLRAGVPVEGTLYAQLRNSKLPANELEETKGYFAYFTALGDDFKTLPEIYASDDPVKEGSFGGPAVPFHLVPSRPGMMMLLAQLRARGEDKVLPFYVRVGP